MASNQPFDNSKSHNPEHGFSDDSVKDYLNRFDRHQLLSHEDEIRLGRLVQLGQLAQHQYTALEASGEVSDPSVLDSLDGVVKTGHIARDNFTESNLRLVVSIAKKYQKRGLELPDLIQEGNEGLMTAVDRYNPEMGFRFSTYATTRIRRCIIRAIYNTSKPIRVPVNLEEKISAVYIARNILIAEKGEEPTLEELMDCSGVSEKDMKKIEEIPVIVDSLDRPVGEDLEDSLGDFVATTRADETFDGLLESYVNDQVYEELISEISEPRAREILKLRFGFNDTERHKLEQLGKKYGLTRERIRQIEARAITQLRDKLGLHLSPDQRSTAQKGRLEMLERDAGYELFKRTGNDHSL